MSFLANTLPDILVARPRHTLFIIIVSIIIMIFSQISAFAVVFPQDFNYSSRIDALVDAGFIWNLNSLIHPLSCYLPDSGEVVSNSFGSFLWLKNYLDDYTAEAERVRPEINDKLRMLFLLGTGLGAQTGAARVYEHLALQPFVWWQARYLDNWYARIYIRATNEVNSIPHYSGTYKGVERMGLNTAETDQAVIGFKNNWLNVEYGRTREIWGPMSEDNLILSGYAPSYDRIMLQFSRKRITYRYFFAFLETYCGESDIIRYNVSRFLEYNNHKNLVLGVSETTIFAGPNRPIDLAFLNPFGFHLEIDLDDRSNASYNYDNAIWGIYFDWMARSNLRITGSIAIDEFQIDKQDRDEGSADGLGYFGRLAWTPIYEPIGVTFFAEGVRLDTYFGQHSYGYANLVSRWMFLGHPIGNDADRISLGLRCVLPIKAMIELEFGRYRWGDNSLLHNPYAPYDEFIRVPFPSGQVRRNDFLEIRIDAQPIRNLSVNISSYIDLHNSGENSALERYTFNLIYLFPFIYEY